MQFNGPDNNQFRVLRPDSIMQMIESDYHKKINELCCIISDFVLQNSHTDDVELSVSELLHLLIAKLNDEIKYLILKESGILFPIIKKDLANTTEKTPIDRQIFESIKNRHLIVSELVDRTRRVLNEQNLLRGLNDHWKLMDEVLILLEDKIHGWTDLEQDLLFPQLTGVNPTATAN